MVEKRSCPAINRILGWEIHRSDTVAGFLEVALARADEIRLFAARISADDLEIV